MKSLSKFLHTLQLQAQPENILSTYRLHMDHAAWQVSTMTGETLFHVTNHVQSMAIMVKRLPLDMTWYTRCHFYEGHSIQSLQLHWDDIPMCQWMPVVGCLHTPWATVHKVSVEEELVVWRRQAWLSASWCFMAIYGYTAILLYLHL